MVLEGVEDLEADVLLLLILAILLFVFELLLVTEDAEAEALEDADTTEPEAEEAEAADEMESAELGRLDGFDFDDALEAAATDVEEVDALLLLEDALAALVVELELLDFCFDLLLEFELLSLLLLDSEVPSFDFFFPRRRRLSMKAN